MNRYHKAVYLPDRIGSLMGEFWNACPERLRYSYHAKLETIKDRYCTVPVIKTKGELKQGEAFEFVLERGRIKKGVIDNDASCIFRDGNGTR